MRIISQEKTGITTMGGTGIVILAGVIFSNLSPWWLLASAFFILSAVGHENGLTTKK
tara:strand:- start:803 stop:973 length:171 start_codon:yes stop_codon:yes gene_type:complete